jgi:NAD(P)-dependent dehydrogenase (short-subunit alcohol dehydrogenase family)
MTRELAGKRALVAGSSSGIGESIARLLARDGAAVVVHGRDGASAAAVVETIIDDGGEAAFVIGDLADAGATEDVARQAVAAYGGIDILVNSAGASPTFGPWLETPPELWEERFRTTTMYAVRLIHALVPPMVERGWGRVVNIGSGVNMKPSAYGPEYSAAKAALHTIAVGLSQALTDSGVTANTVSSGVVLTANTDQVMRAQAERLGFEEEGAALERRVAREMWPIPIGRMGRPEDIAEAVCYLASDRAAFITGANLRVDGGSAGWVN